MAFNLFPKPGKDKSPEGRPSDAKAPVAGRAPTARDAVAAGRAPEPRPDASRETPMGEPASKMEWTLGLQQKIHVVEANPGLCAVLENAALLHANGQSAQARQILEEGIVNDAEAKVSPFAWLSLFDLLQRAGQRAAFDRLAMQYVVAFERSAPGWEDSVIHSRPGPKPTAGGYVGLTGKLSATHATQIAGLLAATQKQPSIRLDLGSLTGADDAGALLLADALAQLRKRKYALTLQHTDKLRRALESAVTQGRSAGEGFWTLLLEMLQWLNDHKGFEDRAVEYAVTFEVSPPSWEPPAHAPAPAVAAPVAEETAEENAETLVFQGVLIGSSDPQLARFAAFRDARHAIPIDMTAVDRIDFVCAGALCNAISRTENQRKTVQIIGATPIVRALLLLIGIPPRHFIRKAE